MLLDGIWKEFAQAQIIDFNGNNWTQDANSWPFPAPFYVISAYNPCGKKQTANANSILHARLEKYLQETFPAALSIETTGENKDGQWKEVSLAIGGIAISDAVDIAQRFDQLAFFRFTENVIQLIAANGAVYHERRLNK